jgi:dTDP-4-dehydrorhamnose 3,5-epimerase
MEFQIETTHFDKVMVVVPDVFQDLRGYFAEVYRADAFKRLGLPQGFVQINQSGSKKNVIRGLHFQWDPPMGKLMRVVQGSAFLVAVDLRKDSATFGKWFGIEVSAEDRKQVWAPASFARGFCALSEFTVVEYQCTGSYNAKAESGIRWDDPDIGIRWPITNPVVSEKDRNAQSLADWLKSPHSEHFRL